MGQKAYGNPLVVLVPISRIVCKACGGRLECVKRGRELAALVWPQNYSGLALICFANSCHLSGHEPTGSGE